MRRLISAPEAKPISLDSVKDQLRIERAWTAEDDYVSELINTAVDYIETICGRALITQTWEVYTSSIGDLTAFKTPLGNLQTVNSVKWRDDAGSIHIVDPSFYTVFSGGDEGTVYCDTSEVLEDIYESQSEPLQENAFSVEIVCGYGEDAESIPAAIRHAIRLIVSDYYENREPVISANTEKAVDRLLNSYRLRSFE